MPSKTAQPSNHAVEDGAHKADLPFQLNLSKKEPHHGRLRKIARAARTARRQNRNNRPRAARNARGPLARLHAGRRPPLQGDRSRLRQKLHADAPRQRRRRRHGRLGGARPRRHRSRRRHAGHGGQMRALQALRRGRRGPDLRRQPRRRRDRPHGASASPSAA